MANSYADMQRSLTQNNRNRVKWVQYSMSAFYIALGLSVLWFAVAMCKIM